MARITVKSKGDFTYLLRRLSQVQFIYLLCVTVNARFKPSGTALSRDPKGSIEALQPFDGAEISLRESCESYKRRESVYDDMRRYPSCMRDCSLDSNRSFDALSAVPC